MSYSREDLGMWKNDLVIKSNKKTYYRLLMRADGE